VRGRFDAKVGLSELEPPSAAMLSGGIDGPLGQASGSGRVRLTAAGPGTRIDYDYEVEVSGKAVAVGARMMKTAADIVIAQFFKRLARQLGKETGAPTDATYAPTDAPTGASTGASNASFWQRLKRALGLAR
jgi:2-furoyl-CoA dehydrogenase large subunit